MATNNWVLDPTHRELGFKIRHLMISNVSGNFGEYEATVQTKNEDFTTAEVKATIQTASINTNNKQRDEHLRNSDFFEVDKFPTILFESTRVDKQDDENFIVHGNFTMKGVTKPVQLNVEFNGLTKDPWGNQRAGFLVTGKINRNEFGLSFNSVLETGGVALSDEVKIHSEIQLVKQEVAVAV